LQSTSLDRDETLYDPASRAAGHIWDRALSAFDTQDFSRSMRVLIWTGTVDMIRAHPWLGCGPGQYWSTIRPFLDQDAWGALMQARTEIPHEPRHAHNEYLELTAEMGLVGMAMMLWLLGTLLWMGKTYLGRRPAVAGRWPPGPVVAETAGALGSMVAFLIHAGFAFNLHNPVAWTYFSLFAGLMVAVNERKTVPSTRRVSAKSETGAGLMVALVAGGVGAVLLGATGLRILMGDFYYAQGVRAVGGQRMEEAQTAFRRAVRWRAYDFQYHRTAGRLYLMLGSDPQAQAELERSLLLHPNDAGALRLLGGVLNRGGGNAIQILERAVKLDPTNTRGYALLASAYRNMGDADSAIALLRRVLSTRPHEPRLVMALGLAQHDLGKLDQCLATLERALRMAPEDGRIAGNLGAIYLEIGRPGDAEELLRQAVRRDSRNAMEWEANLSRALALQGKTDEARASAVEALTRTRDAEGLIELHRALLEKSDQAEP